MTGRAHVLCGVLLLLAPSAPVPARAQEELPPSAALTYRTDVGLNGTSRFVVILADGPAPEQDVVLTDETGRLVVIASPVAVDDPLCPIETLRTTLGTDKWCLQLSGVRAGAKAAGRLVGAEAIVELSVEARHDWRNPALFTLAALLIALGLVLVTTRWLPSLLIRAQLWSVTLRDHDITGFRTWAKDVAGVRLSRRDTLARLNWARRNGTRRIAAARAGLLAKVSASQLVGSPLLEDATAEATRTDVEIADVLTETGAVKSSAAADLLVAMTRAEAARADFVASADSLLKRITDPDDLTTANALRAHGLSLHEDVLRSRTVPQYEQALTDCLAGIQDRVPTRTKEERLVIGLAAAGPPGADGAEITGAAPGSGALAVLPVVAATAAAVAAAALVMAIAAAATLAAVYVPSQTFGTFADYLTLGTTAIGSSSIAGVLTLLLLLRGPDDWYG